MVKRQDVQRYGILTAILVILLVALVVFTSYKKSKCREGFVDPKPKVIWTCTTFLDFPKKDRWQAFTSCMDTLLAQNSKEDLARIEKWIVVNEYAVAPKQDWATQMKERYPFVEFIQKTKEQQGQAKGLNMILERIKPYTYWFHWEETWDTRGPFIAKAIAVMNENPDITQLQMTHDGDHVDWLDVPATRIHCRESVCRIDPHEQTPTFINDDVDTIDLRSVASYWPLYSLRPSINRVAFYTGKDVGKFPEDPALWPWLFELHYAIRWVRAGAVKAVLKDAPIVRQENHASTY